MEKKRVMPHLLGEPSLVEADPRMLPTHPGQCEKKNYDREKKKKSGRRKEVSRVTSLLCAIQ